MDERVGMGGWVGGGDAVREQNKKCNCKVWRDFIAVCRGGEEGEF